MDAQNLRKLKDAFNLWAKNHPSPDEGILGMGHEMLSAKEIARKIEDETDIGRMLIDTAQYMIDSKLVKNLDDIATRLSPQPPRP